MKFSQLAIGQHFAWQGQTWVKSTPLQADPVEGGKRRLVPRSATVEPLEAESAADTLPACPSQIPLERLEQAMDAFGRELSDIGSGLDAEASAQALRQLQKAFARLRHRLDLDR
ncbi:hypothetical protein [endosymbiont of unidentified scaly snail isolate Monju]|uniref:hypothetical protein n=1 Tax=endosymbiont of unidentified scaly snail isolate Monju TaxID=1248727 RepID=UPI0003892201|nr:hypothetical protein [endosymbiont of unidentified scaly snail isolate Monju]BAN69788.1 hypothetical protein EBS_1923 [endosymbiont of unidentified scaly snail isolate Monju]